MAGISWGVETASSGSVFVGTTDKTADTKMFLKDVMGLDFSKHREPFVDRGFDNLETLNMDAGAAAGDVAARVGGERGGTWGRKGLSALEVVPLDLAIRALGNGKKGRGQSMWQACNSFGVLHSGLLYI
ncbi:hypothetical protein B0H13DRAFT_2355684 [Mycena leptocephala]|nr:hypothetical protein B0H13DRAFT_2355684 [Mycena leptocephala]